MGWSQNSDYFSIFEPMNSKNFSSTHLTAATNSQFHHPSHLVAPYQSLQAGGGHSLAYYPVYPFFLGQNGIEFGVSSSIHASNGVQGSCFMQTDWLSRYRRILDPYRTKLARINRKLARQRSLNLQRNNASSVVSNQVYARRLISSGADTNTKRDLFKFCTPDNKRLRLLLRKELRTLGPLGELFFQREAEVNLPTLYDKEGIQVMIKDVYCNQMWTLKYKDFVKQNGLGIEDSLTLYEDENKNLNFSILKVARVAAEASSNQHCDNVNNNDDNDDDNSNMYLPFTCQSKDDEETSLELLIEQLKHKEQQQEEANEFMILPMDAAYSNRFPDSVATYSQTSSTLSGGKSRRVDDIQINFDDCYGGLDMLPDVNHYNFSL